MLVSTTPRTDGWEELGPTSLPPSLHWHWAVCPVQPCKDKQMMLSKSITHVLTLFVSLNYCSNKSRLLQIHSEKADNFQHPGTLLGSKEDVGTSGRWNEN